MAQAYPQLRIVGLDVWPAALVLAAETTAVVRDRVELREGNIAQLGDEARYDAVFLPGPFLSGAAMSQALPAVWRALRPGGWVFAAIYAPSADALAQALLDLRAVRAGGVPWRGPDLAERLRVEGFAGVEVVLPQGPLPAAMVVGQRVSSVA